MKYWILRHNRPCLRRAEEGMSYSSMSDARVKIFCLFAPIKYLCVLGPDDNEKMKIDSRPDINL